MTMNNWCMILLIILALCSFIIAIAGNIIVVKSFVFSVKNNEHTLREYLLTSLCVACISFGNVMIYKGVKGIVNNVKVEYVKFKNEQPK